MSEKKTVKKWFWVWDFEKEEKWLNEMADAGWLLNGVGFCKYVFIPCEPGSYTLRLEMHDKDMQYIDGLEDTGAEYVGNMMSWLYFRKKNELGAFDLFTDLDARTDHLERIGKMLFCLAAANLCIGLANLPQRFTFGGVNLALAALVMYGYGCIRSKKELLMSQKEKETKE